MGRWPLGSLLRRLGRRWGAERPAKGRRGDSLGSGAPRRPLYEVRLAIGWFRSLPHGRGDVEVMLCGQCGEPAEKGRPIRDIPDVEPARMRYRHKDGKEPLCPEMTLKGYQPSYPKGA